ncbi:MAG: electron transfer flavoprotein subunit alpha/FixB family protein [Syntrophaceae bacterium]|nr:electron transfer flavoprotein subunit alpha/FixB family protein [Syntrophaceae bacterium]
MKNIYVLAEHRNGTLRDTTWEALSAARSVSSQLGGEIVCLLLGNNVSSISEKLAQEFSKVVVVEDPNLETFNSDAMTQTLSTILKDESDYLLLMGNSNSVIDLAPGLSVVLDAALATDCFGFEVSEGQLLALRQIYSYKINALVSFKNCDKIVVTLRSGSFSFTPAGQASGTIEKRDSPLASAKLRKTFVSYEEAEKGDVDISSAEIIVSIGRGIGDEPDMDMYQSLADTVGGVLACSRPIVDKNLLPKYHQVGTSGIEVKPKIYLALGISGAFQHVGGIKGSPLIMAVNKDPRAPIFRVAQYGVVGDINEIVPALEEKIKELKG